jgi:hypothetical protein
METCRRLCSSSVTWLRQRALQWISKMSDEPVLMQCSADGTPISTRQIFQSSCDHMPVTRHGKQSAEYLVQRVFLMGLDRRPLPVFRDPVHMGNKTASVHMKAGMDLFPHPRELGHTGLLVDHRVYDRAVMSAMKKLWYRWSLAHHQFTREVEGEAVAHRLWLTHWRSVVGCFGHDCHGGLRWGVFHLLSDKDVVRDSYIAVESLRNGFDVIECNLVPWITAHLQFEDSPLSVEERNRVWMLFGLSGGWLDVAVSLQVRWENGCLKVGIEQLPGEPLVQRIKGLLMKLFKFSKFTDSRWVTLGTTGRAIIAGYMVGLPSLVDWCIKNPSTSSWYIKGFLRMSDACRHLYSVVGLSSFVADSCLHLILKDGRLPRLMGQVDECLVEEFQYLVSIPPRVWSLLADVCKMDEKVLINDCIMSALTQAAYILNKCRPARNEPFTLARGDKLANLQRLAERADRPAEETTGKIWELLRRGVPPEDLVAGLQLLDEVDWTGTPVEQGHVKASRLMMKHPLYTQDSMQCRAQVATVSALFSPTAADLNVKRIQGQIDRQLRCRPASFGGRQLFLKTLNQSTDRSVDSGQNWGPAGSLRKKIMKAHGSLWHKLPVGERDRFEQLAAHERDAKAKVADQFLQSLHDKLEQAKLEGLDQRIQMSCLFGSPGAGFPTKIVLTSIRFARAPNGLRVSLQVCGIPSQSGVWARMSRRCWIRWWATKNLQCGIRGGCLPSQTIVLSCGAASSRWLMLAR